MKNYLGHTLLLTLLVTIMLLGLSLVAPANIFGFKLRQANILVDLVSDSTLRAVAGLPPIEVNPYENMLAEWVDDQYLDFESPSDTSSYLHDTIHATPVAIDTLPGVVTSVDTTKAEATQPMRDSINRRRARADMTNPQGLTPIKDYAPDESTLLPFFEKLNQISTLGRPVRIAVLGDSFIEGDIMTADLRELFQERFSGAGVGFVPITSQVASFRRSVEHTFDGWQQKTIVNNSKEGRYTLSGTAFHPSSPAPFVQWKGSRYKKHLDRVTQARLLFVNQGTTRIKALVNGTRSYDFAPASSEQLQQITINDTIQSIRFDFESTDGFIGYGAILGNDYGVSIDNYSLRGNSGIPLGLMDPVLTSSFMQIAPCDLIILEYGLNAASSEVTDYSAYKKQMIRVIERIRLLCPQAAILVMSVSDRSTRVAGEFVTMQGIKAMEHSQHEMARTTGVAFWSTLDAMRAMGGMVKFVENGWAAADYTHVGAKGGRKVATALFEALMFEKSKWDAPQTTTLTNEGI